MSCPDSTKTEGIPNPVSLPCRLPCWNSLAVQFSSMVVRTEVIQNILKYCNPVQSIFTLINVSLYPDRSTEGRSPFTLQSVALRTLDSWTARMFCDYTSPNNPFCWHNIKRKAMHHSRVRKMRSWESCNSSSIDWSPVRIKPWHLTLPLWLVSHTALIGGVSDIEGHISSRTFAHS